MSILLTFCGVAALAIGAWRGWSVAREALGPLVHDGDPTRSAIEAARPIHARFRIRLFVRRLGVALAWLLVASYGLYLIAAGTSAT
jgi:hypothetical protein